LPTAAIAIASISLVEYFLQLFINSETESVDAQTVTIPLATLVAVVIVSPVIVMPLIPSLRAYIRRDRRQKSARLTVDALGSRIEVEIGSTFPSGAQRSRSFSSGAIAPLQRDFVLREILNLESYSFEALKGLADGKLPPWHVRFLTGISRAELACLRKVRMDRHKLMASNGEYEDSHIDASASNQRPSAGP
jgi:hypothetical protein